LNNLFINSFSGLFCCGLIPLGERRSEKVAQKVIALQPFGQDFIRKEVLPCHLALFGGMPLLLTN